MPYYIKGAQMLSGRFGSDGSLARYLHDALGCAFEQDTLYSFNHGRQENIRT